MRVEYKYFIITNCHVVPYESEVVTTWGLREAATEAAELLVDKKKMPRVSHL